MALDDSNRNELCNLISWRIVITIGCNRFSYVDHITICDSLLDLRQLVSTSSLPHASLTFRPQQNSHHSADETFKCICVTEKVALWLGFHWNLFVWVPLIICYHRSQIAKSMGPIWGPPGADRTQVGPMLASWTLLSGMIPAAPLSHICSSLRVNLILTGSV